MLCYHVGKGEALATASHSSVPLRTSILPPHHAGTCVGHRLDLQKWMWLHLAGAPVATCPVWWEGITSAGQLDHHLCPQPSPSKVGHCPEHQQGTQKEAAKLPEDMKIKFLVLLYVPFLSIVSDTSLGGEA